MDQGDKHSSSVILAPTQLMDALIGQSWEKLFLIVNKSIQALVGMLEKSQGHPLLHLLMGQTLPQPHSSPHPHPAAGGTDLSVAITPPALCGWVKALTLGRAQEDTSVYKMQCKVSLLLG